MKSMMESTKVQAPTSTTKLLERDRCVGIFEFLWCLEIGIWSFSFRQITKSNGLSGC